MFFYKYVTVTGIANTEVLETLLTSTETEPKHIDALCYIESTATENWVSILRAYVENVRILDFPQSMLLVQALADPRLAEGQWIPIDRDLGVGEELKVGHVSGGTIANFQIAVRYRVT